MLSINKLFALSSCVIAAVSAASINSPRQSTLPPPFGGEHNGVANIFGPGLGACGVTNSPNDLVASISAELFDNFPGATTNPNNNPICHESVTVNYKGKSITAKVVDRCGGCAEFGLDLSPAAFDELAGNFTVPVEVNWFFDELQSARL